MSFGVDGALILAITSAIAWAKRADVVEGNVHRMVLLCSGGDEEKAMRAAKAIGGSIQPPPSLLLKGFDLQQPLPQPHTENHMEDYTGERGGSSKSSGWSAETPRVPHRFADGCGRVPEGLPRHVTDWTAAQRRRLAVSAERSQDTSRLRAVMQWLVDQHEWEGALRLLLSYEEVCKGGAAPLPTDGEACSSDEFQPHRHVVDRHLVQLALQALLQDTVGGGDGDVESLQRLQAAADIMVRMRILPVKAQHIHAVLRLVELRSVHAEQLSRLILSGQDDGGSLFAADSDDMLLTPRSQPTNGWAEDPHVLASLLVSLCSASPSPAWSAALDVYSRILSTVHPLDARRKTTLSTWWRGASTVGRGAALILSSLSTNGQRLPATLWNPIARSERRPAEPMGSEASAPSMPIRLPVQQVFHVLLPALCRAMRPVEASEVLRDMMEIETEQAKSEVLLELLRHPPIGVDLVSNVMGIKTATDAQSVEVLRSDLAAKLFSAHCNPRTLNSFLSVLSSIPEVSETATCKEHVAVAMSAVRSGACPLQVDDWLCVANTVASPSPSSWSVALCLVNEGLRNGKLLRQLSTQPLSVATSASSSHGGHRLSPLMALTQPLLRHGLWKESLNVLTTAVARQQQQQQRVPLKGGPVAHTYGALVFCAFALRKHAAGHFWMDRAHQYGLTLPSSLYDTAIKSAAATSWLPALEVLCKARHVGACCSEEGLLTILASAERSKKTADVLKVMSLTDSARWVP